MNLSVIYEPKGRAYEYAPLALNLYHGCSHGCTYCYVPGIRRMTLENHTTHCNPRPRVLENLRHDARLLSKAGDQREILMCFTSDPYQHIEEKYRLTHQAITTLMAHGLRFTILTKGGARSIPDMDLYKDYPKARYGVTLSFSQQASADAWEPNSASIAERYAALRQAHRLGISTWVSVEPVIYPNEAVDLIDQFDEVVDFWKVGKINHHPIQKETDWAAFLEEVVTLLEHLGTPYYIKKDLAEFGDAPPPYTWNTQGGQTAHAIPDHSPTARRQGTLW